MKVAQAISKALRLEGVRVAAGITGQSIGHVADAFAEEPGAHVFYVRQERVAFDICDGFARAGGTPGVVFTDAGPAAANAMGGIVNSLGDSVPVLFIAGHNDRFEVPSGQTKEIPFLELFGPVSKWAAVINDPSQVAEIMRRAFMHLRTGRGGPVIVGMPFDVSSMEIENFDYQPVGSRPRVRAGGDPAEIRKAVDLIAAAKRPYVYVGAGVLASEATPQLVEFAELLTLPVATTLNGKSAFPEDHALALGIGGFARAAYGSLPATVLAETADVIVTIGCGFKRHATRKLPPSSAKHVQVDVDPGELNKNHIAEVAIQGDAAVVIGQMIDAARSIGMTRLAPVADRLAEVRALKERWADVSAPLLNSEESPINPFRVTAEISRQTQGKPAIVLHDAGSVRGSTSQHYVARAPRSFLGFGVQSAMGWSIGAAIGAKCAEPGKLVIAVVGEEAFNETAMDIETSIRCNTPVLIIVKNNRAFTDRDGGVSANLARVRFGTGVDIPALAAALGAKTQRVTQPTELEGAFKEAIAAVEAGTTAVLEIMTRRVKTSLYDLWDKPAA
jgi:acetolactate synthase-1/2/3 large subunit